MTLFGYSVHPADSGTKRVPDVVMTIVQCHQTLLVFIHETRN